jgi:hypothetical protein
MTAIYLFLIVSVERVVDSSVTERVVNRNPLTVWAVPMLVGWCGRNPTRGALM